MKGVAEFQFSECRNSCINGMGQWVRMLTFKRTLLPSSRFFSMITTLEIHSNFFLRREESVNEVILKQLV